MRYYGKIHSKLPIIRVKSVELYTGQKKFTPEFSWLSRQISGMPVISSLKSQKYQLGHDLVELHIELGLEPNLGGSTAVVAKLTQRNLLSTLASSKRMGNSCCCTEQMFYKYFLGPPHVEGAILMVSNYLSCFVTLWLIGLILWARTYHKKPITRKI